MEGVEHPGSQIRFGRLEGGNKVGEKTGRIVVLFIQGKPGSPDAVIGKPLADQRCFSKTRRSGDECQLPGEFFPPKQVLIQKSAQFRSFDSFNAGRRNVEFCCEQG